MVRIGLRMVNIIMITSLAVSPIMHQAAAHTDTQRIALQIPMRDGKYLAGDLYSSNQNMKKPVILIQTPYNKAVYWSKLEEFIPFSVESYHIVITDWRGRFASKKAASRFASNAKDGYDTVEWIAKQKWSDGKIGTYGGSALGMVQFQTASLQPPHLVCAIPMIKDFQIRYDGFYTGGVYREEHGKALERLGFYESATILEHPLYNRFWQFVEQQSDLAKTFQIPMLLISGWFDYFPDQVLRAFADIRQKSHPSIREKHKLIFGPWEHSRVDQTNQGILSYPHAKGFGAQESVRFMDFYLLNRENDWEATPVIRYYQMGEELWKNCDQWDTLPRKEVSFYLQPGKLLSPSIPSISNVSSTFTYDPADPTPSFGGKRFTPGVPNTPSGPQDQRDIIETRSDVLVYTSEPMQENLPINGLIRAEIFISSDQRDTDISVRFCDVYPDGSSVLMAEGIQRGRLRKSLEQETFFQPYTVDKVTVTLQSIALTILKGHQIRITVSSASYPIFAKNLNNDGPLYQDSTMKVAHNTIWFDKEHPSRLLLPIKK